MLKEIKSKDDNIHADVIDAQNALDAFKNEISGIKGFGNCEKDVERIMRDIDSLLSRTSYKLKAYDIFLRSE